MNRETQKVNSLLIIQLAGLGDMVMATPAIEALRKLYPEARLCLLTNPRSLDSIRGSPYIDEIIVIKGFTNIFAALRKLRKSRFEMVINLYRLYSLQGAIKMFLLFLAIGGKKWVGRDTAGRGFFYHLKIPEKLSDKRHEVEYKLDIVRTLGAKIEAIDLKAAYDAADEDFVNRLLDKEGLALTDLIVGINCSTFKLLNNWTIEGYAKLADLLIERLKVKVAFVGVESEKTLFARIKEDMRYQPLDLVGRLNVRQLTCFLRRCRVFISPDSGPVHIAAAFKIPIVVLFGPGECERYRPYGNEEKTIVIKKEVPCGPCYKEKCSDRKCMDLITPDEVFQAARQLLGS